MYLYLYVSQDVLNSLQEKLNISCVENFSLVLQNMKSSCHGKMSLLQENESLAEVKKFIYLFFSYSLKGVLEGLQYNTALLQRHF